MFQCVYLYKDRISGRVLVSFWSAAVAGFRAFGAALAQARTRRPSRAGQSSQSSAGSASMRAVWQEEEQWCVIHVGVRECLQQRSAVSPWPRWAWIGRIGQLQGRSDVLNVCYGLKYVRVVSPNPETREGTLLPFVIGRGQPVDRGQRVGIARRRRAPRSPEHLGGLLVVVVCVEKCGMSLMSITCGGCGGGARWSCSGTMGPAARCRRASRCPHLSRQSCRGVSWKPAPESTTSSTTAAMHLPGVFSFRFSRVAAQDGRRFTHGSQLVILWSRRAVHRQ
jgi:hypothetical protein